MSDFIKTDVPLPEAGKLHVWAMIQLQKYGDYLLAFADDGIIWGRLVNGVLITSHDAAKSKFPDDPTKWNSPEFREETIQQIFIFGKDSEVRLFKDELGNWKTLRVVDASVDSDEIIIESQILWGDQSEGDAQDGFLQVSEFRKGIPNQYLPVDGPLGKDDCVRLKVHHLVEYGETGEARIAISRLAGLKVYTRDIGKKELEAAK
jgi:CRISPR-associated protein (TIGR03984 family)